MDNCVTMTNRYLEKIAEQEKKKHGGFEPMKAIGSTVLGSVAAIPFLAGGIYQGDKVINSHDNKGNSDMGTVKKMMRDHKINVSFNHRPHSHSKIYGSSSGDDLKALQKHVSSLNNPNHGAAFLNATLRGGDKGYIGGVKYKPVGYAKNSWFTGKSKPVPHKVIKNTDTIMHELGHAKDYQKGSIRKAIFAGTSSRLAPIAAVAALSHEKTRDYAPAIMAAGQIATMRDEGMANYHAYKAIKAHKGPIAAKNFVRTFVGKQMGSYGLVSAGSIAGIYAAKKIMDKWSPKKETK